MVTHRFTVTLEEGDMSERQEIYPIGIEMFREKPVLGWGPYVNSQELGNRLAVAKYERMDTHNMILYVLTATGLLGSIPFLLGVWLCLKGAWDARHGAQGVLPLAMAACLLTADMSVSGLHWKQHWIVLAYALASAYPVATKLRGFRLRPRRAVPLFRNRPRAWSVQE